MVFFLICLLNQSNPCKNIISSMIYLIIVLIYINNTATAITLMTLFPLLGNLLIVSFRYCFYKHFKDNYRPFFLLFFLSSKCFILIREIINERKKKRKTLHHNWLSLIYNVSMDLKWVGWGNWRKNLDLISLCPSKLLNANPQAQEWPLSASIVFCLPRRTHPFKNSFSSTHVLDLPPISKPVAARRKLIKSPIIQ